MDADSGLDFRWSNPTTGYLLIQSTTDDTNVYFGLYCGQQDWTVSVDQPLVSHQVTANQDPVAEVEPSLPWGRIQLVETARDGFDVAINRTVTREDGQPRTLTLKSGYQPSRTVTLVGTKGKPADADVNAVLARVAPPRPAPAAAAAAPSAAPSPVVTNAPVAGSAALATENPPAANATVSARPARAQTSTPPPTLISTPTAATRAAATAAATPTATRPGGSSATPTSTTRPPATAEPRASPSPSTR